MGNKFMNKVWNLLGVETDEYDGEYSDYEMPELIQEEKEYVAPVNNKKRIFISKILLLILLFNYVYQLICNL